MPSAPGVRMRKNGKTAIVFFSTPEAAQEALQEAMMNSDLEVNLGGMPPQSH